MSPPAPGAAAAPARAEAGYHTRDTCRGCGGPGLEPVLDYGDMPLAGGFPRPQEARRERRYPLTLARCAGCGLVQVLEVVSAEELFRDYRYRASVPLSRHFAAYAARVPDRLSLPPDALVVEAGCNDGVLLRPLRERGFQRLLGVDPADNVTRHVPPGIPVVSDFFEPAVARRIRAEHGPAKLLAANNVFAHMDDPNAFAAAAAALLDRDGSFVFEVHYLLDLVEGFQYDTVYHEHVLYYSLSALRPLLARHGLRLFDVERIPNHGASIRAYACHQAGPRRSTPELERARDVERQRGLGDVAEFRRFAAGVRRRVRALDELLEAHAARGERIAAYGAAGRATILFNVSTAAKSQVAYVVDDSPERVGRLMPGAHTPIVPAERLVEDPPDLVLLSAWSYADVLQAKVRERLSERRAPAFCVPLPEPRLLRG